MENCSVTENTELLMSKSVKNPASFEDVDPDPVPARIPLSGFTLLLRYHTPKF